MWNQVQSLVPHARAHSHGAAAAARRAATSPAVCRVLAVDRPLARRHDDVEASGQRNDVSSTTSSLRSHKEDDARGTLLHVPDTPPAPSDAALERHHQQRRSHRGTRPSSEGGPPPQGAQRQPASQGSAHSGQAQGSWGTSRAERVVVQTNLGLTARLGSNVRGDVAPPAARIRPPSQALRQQHKRRAAQSGSSRGVRGGAPAARPAPVGAGQLGARAAAALAAASAASKAAEAVAMHLPPCSVYDIPATLPASSAARRALAASSPPTRQPAAAAPVAAPPAAAAYDDEAEEEGEDEDALWRAELDAFNAGGGGGSRGARSGGGAVGTVSAAPPPRDRWVSQLLGRIDVRRAAAVVPADMGELEGYPVVYVNLALQRLANMRPPPAAELERLCEYALSRTDCNEHTYAAAFVGLAAAGRLGAALQRWGALCAARVDVGPVGACGLLTACARARDTSAALTVFDQMLRRRVTLNRYAYNCLTHMLAVAGRIDDALAVYNLQRLETDGGSLPDTYSYAALMRGVLVSGRVELVNQVYENMLEDGVIPDSKLWCHLITAAGRAQELALARQMYRAAMVSGWETAAADAYAADREAARDGGWPSGGADAGAGAGAATGGAQLAAAGARRGRDAPPAPKLHLVNALLTAHAQSGDLKGALKVYELEVVRRGLRADGFTFNALLTAAARSGSSQLTVADVVGLHGDMADAGVALSTHTGTALLGAYRRARANAAAAAAAAGSGGGVARGVGRELGGGASGDAGGGGGGRKRSSRKGGGRGSSMGSSNGASDGCDLGDCGGAGPGVAAGLHAEAESAVQRALGVLGEMQVRRVANDRAYTVAMAMLLEAGRPAQAAALQADAAAAGVVLGGEAREVLLRAADETGLVALAAQLRRDGGGGGGGGERGGSGEGRGGAAAAADGGDRASLAHSQQLASPARQLPSRLRASR